MEIIIESKAKIEVHTGKISKDLPVFYNPEMKLNRDISVVLLNALDNSGLRIALPLAGSGIRGIRFLLESYGDKINEIHFNDGNSEAVDNIKNNLELNKIKLNEKIKITNRDATKFLLESSGFDYIDLDPFGSPNPYLDAAVKRISRNGVLAVTATDTAPLCGTYLKTCLRKYWAKPLRNELKHEIGLRILIRKVQLIGAQYDKALIPIFSYWRSHYFRVFFRCVKGKKNVDEIIKHHSCFGDAGPLWLGKLKDESFVKKLESGNNFVQLLKQELDIPFFYDIHVVCKKNKLSIPKREKIMEEIKKKGFKVSSTHFSHEAVKTDMQIDDFIYVLKSLQ